MDTRPVLVFQALGPNQRPISTLMDALEMQEGFMRAFFGVKMEDPAQGVLCTEWSSTKTATAYRESRLMTAVGEKEAVGFEAAGQQDWHAVLSAPCTEVFTATGTEEGFLQNVASFVGALEANPPEGYEGAAFGERADLLRTDRGCKKAVRMMLGWTSREAHMEAKEKPGAIQENIHKLREKRDVADLFHVQFRRP